MPSITSGTTNFTLDVDDIIEEALEPIGGDWSSGVEQAKIRRSLNLILIELQNKNIPLNKIEEVTFNLAAASYTFDGSVVDVQELTMTDPSTQSYTSLGRDGRKEFHLIPNKAQTGRPTTYTTDRNAGAVTAYVWPVPNQTYPCKALVTKRVEDVTASYQKIDLSYRYYPLLVYWLSYDLALKRDGVPQEKIDRIRNRLNEIMPDTFEEDRERVDWNLRPGGISGK